MMGAVLTTICLIAFNAKAAFASSERIMVYGDSLSAAYGIDQRDGWVSLLQAKMHAEGVTVINSSISGETTAGGSNRLMTDLAKIKPTIVVLALGANDGLRGLPTAETRKNLQSMIVKIQAARAKVVLIAIQIPPNYGIEYSRQFRELYFDLARSNRLPPPPFLLEGIAERLELFQADRLHPKAEAQSAILDNVLPAIRKALNKPVSAANSTPKS
ncbi:MAG: arylesterase [Betaproteobacteria bacterium]